MSEVFASRNQQDTEEIGRRTAGRLKPPATLLLSGPLGAGKTAFVRGLAEGCGCDPRLVHSPSFSLVNHYSGKPPLIHVDLYRLETLHQLHTIGLDEMLDGEAIVVIEWAERLPWPLADAWRVRIEVTGEQERQLTLTPPG